MELPHKLSVSILNESDPKSNDYQIENKGFRACNSSTHTACCMFAYNRLGLLTSLRIFKVTKNIKNTY